MTDTHEEKWQVVVPDLKTPVLIRCPTCGHMGVRSGIEFLRGGSWMCESCGTHLKANPQSSRATNYSSVVLNVKSKSGKIDAKLPLNIAKRVDGIWFFLDDVEGEILETLDHDSDRAVAVIVGSMIESRVARALKARMPNKDRKIIDQVFSISGALGTFGAKIDLAYLYGLVSKDAFDDLKQIKTIRNAFAHDLSIKDFSSMSIKDRTKNLTLIESQVVETEKDVNGQMKFVDMQKDAKPTLFARHAEQRKKFARERYLLTAQLFTIRLAYCEIPGYDIPFI